MKQADPSLDAQPTLKRGLSLPLVTLYGLGTILGAGIYVLVGKVAGESGMYAPLAFVVACLLAVFTAFSYAELSARFPRSAGEAVYVQQGFRLQWLSMTVGFLVILMGAVSSATLANGFVGYLQVFVAAPEWLVITTLVIALGLLASWGIAESVTIAGLVTMIEIAGLVLIVIIAGDSLATLPQRWTELVPSIEPRAWQAILLGAFLAFYAFIGFEDIVNVAEEVKDAERNLPRAILLALGVATTLYLLVALVAVLSLPLDALAASRAPLALVYAQRTGATPALITVISLFAVINGALIQIIMASRVLYGMGAQRWLPGVFARIHPLTRTPVVATAVISTAILVLALWLPLVMLAKVTSLLTLIVFALINLALLRIKRLEPVVLGLKTYPVWIPIIGFVVSVGIVIFQLLTGAFH